MESLAKGGSAVPYSAPFSASTGQAFSSATELGSVGSLPAKAELAPTPDAAMPDAHGADVTLATAPAEGTASISSLMPFTIPSSSSPHAAAKRVLTAQSSQEKEPKGIRKDQHGLPLAADMLLSDGIAQRCWMTRSSSEGASIVLCMSRIGHESAPRIPVSCP